jgi:hypothetical protein
MKRLLSVQVPLTTEPACPGRRLFVPAWGLSLLLAGLSACSSAPPWPPLPLPDNPTRQDIERLRAREQDRLQNALRECYQRFAVNDCRREATTRHNEVQHQLRTQELRLNALDREERQRKLQSDPTELPPGSQGTSSGTGAPR